MTREAQLKLYHKVEALEFEIAILKDLIEQLVSHDKTPKELERIKLKAKGYIGK